MSTEQYQAQYKYRRIEQRNTLLLYIYEKTTAGDAVTKSDLRAESCDMKLDDYVAALEYIQSIGLVDSNSGLEYQLTKSGIQHLKLEKLI